MALSKNRIKYIRSLELKKNRKADKVFLAEGPKLVGDLLGHFRCRFLIATAEWLSAHRHLAVEDVTEDKVGQYVSYSALHRQIGKIIFA